MMKNHSNNNTYSTSYGTRLTRSQIESLIRKAKEKKLDKQLLEHGYNFCERTGKNKNCGEPLDCDPERKAVYIYTVLDFCASRNEPIPDILAERVNDVIVALRERLHGTEALSHLEWMYASVTSGTYGSGI